jgi:hypothetical protein
VLKHDVAFAFVMLIDHDAGKRVANNIKPLRLVSHFRLTTLPFVTSCASQEKRAAQLRNGSQADISECPRNVRYSPRKRTSDTDANPTLGNGYSKSTKDHANFSTGTLNGNAPTPIATRAWSPISGPNTSWINDDAPFISNGNAVKPAADATMP